MSKQGAGSRDAYYAGAESWANDRQDSLRASRRLAWIVAGAAVLVAVCEASAVVFLSTRTAEVPYTLMVDRTTGFVQQLRPLNPPFVSDKEALTRSFLAQYVIAREGYDIDAANANYRKVQLWSAGAAKSDYLAPVKRGDADSLLVSLPRTLTVDVRIKSITPVEAIGGGNVSLVRFQTIRHVAGGQQSLPANWAAVVRYGYSNAALSFDDRLLNPLGFQVQRYRVSPETVPEPEPIASPAPVPTATSTPTPQNSLGGYPRTLPQPAPYR